MYRPIGPTPLFVAPYAGAAKTTFNLIQDDAILARYDQTVTRVGLNVGVNLGARSDVRAGAYIGRSSASIDVGDPGFPELRGKETGAELDAPLTQLTASANQFWSVGPAARAFVSGSLGTSFDAVPLPTNQFALGIPFRLGAYGAGELRGPHYYVVTGGYLRRVGRLPDFMGGPVFAGGWLENGDAFEEWQQASLRTHGGAGLVVDTLFGPLILAGSWSFDRRWRTYLAIGRAFG